LASPGTFCPAHRLFSEKNIFNKELIAMKTKSLIVFSVLLLALLLGACAPGAVGPSGQPVVRTLTVSGEGQAYLAPDIASIYLGVHTENETAADAVAENTAQTQKVIKAITDFGIDPKDVRTTNFSIWPMDRFDPSTGAPSGEKTYAVDNTVYVTVRDLETLGDLLDTVVQAGANTVNSIQFDVAEKDEGLQQARADALEDAKAQAQALADSAGLSLGEIQSISFVDNQFPIFADKGGGGGAVSEAAVPIQPGQLTFTVTVNVTYELK
jgi:uncharacterized protein YggE